MIIIKYVTNRLNFDYLQFKNITIPMLKYSEKSSDSQFVLKHEVLISKIKVGITAGYTLSTLNL